MPDHPQSKVETNKVQMWLRWILLYIITLSVLFKFIKYQPTITVFDLKSSDLLSLLLALFSILLSSLFYFKATETSNKFYDNTYKFTSNISEILGRIESGFGERLKHLDEGYTALSGNGSRALSQEKTEDNIKKELEELKNQEQEKTKIINDLMTKAKIQETEKQSILEALNMREKAWHESRNQLDFLKKRLDIINKQNNDEQHLKLIKKHREFDIGMDLTSSMYNFISGKLIDLLGGIEVRRILGSVIIKRFDVIRDELPKEFLNDLHRYGFIDNSQTLTPRGVELIRDIARARYSSN